MPNLSKLYNVAKAASGMSISLQDVSLRFLKREGSSKKFTTKHREKGGG